MSQRVRVLMVVKGFEIQGISKVVLDYVEHIDRQKFQVDVVSGDNFAKSNVIQLKATGGKLWCIPDRDKNIFVYILKLARIVKSGSYKIVHAHGNSAMIIPELIAAELGAQKSELHILTMSHVIIRYYTKRYIRYLVHCIHTL